MALLKSGSTVGGNLIWHQGLLPLYPAGDTLYLKNYKIYTENDKPTTEELNVYAKPALDASRFVCENRNASTLWFLMGRLKQFGQGGETIGFKFYGGSGYNGRTNQMDTTELVIKTGNGATNIGVNQVGRIASKLYRTYGSTSNPSIQNVAIIETSAHNYDVYVNLIGFTNNMICEITARTIPETAQKFEKVMAQQSVAPVSVMNTDNIAMYSTELKPNNADVGLGNVTNDAQVKKSGDTMTGALYMQRNVSGTAEDVINISGEQHSPIKLFRNANSNLNISFEVTGQKRRYLGIGLNGRLGWGEDPNQGINGLVYTTEFKPSNTDVDAFFQDSVTLGSRNLNDIRSPGQYYQVANSEALATRNYPEQKAGSLSVWKNLANGDGYIQEYRVYDADKIYQRRYRATWSAWVRIYNEGNKPTLTELDAMQASLTGNWNTSSTVPQFVADAANGPSDLNNFGINIPHPSGSFATQITGRNDKLWYRSKQDGKFNSWWRIYHEGNKPTATEIGLGNVTNDAQVKKAGDTMTGNLTLSGSASLSVAGTASVTGKLTVNQTSGFGVNTATVLGANSIAIGDSDTGFRQTGDGVLQALANNTAVFQITNTEFRSYKSVGVEGQITLNGNQSINFNKSGVNPKNFRIFHAGDATRGGRIEIAGEGTGQWIAYFNQAPNEEKSMVVNGSITSNTTITSAANMIVGQSTHHTDGNISGPLWGGGYISTYINNQDASIRARADDAWNKANDAQLNRVGDIARGGAYVLPEGERWVYEVPDGHFLTGWDGAPSDGNVRYVRWRSRPLMKYVQSLGWVQIGSIA